MKKRDMGIGGDRIWQERGAGLKVLELVMAWLSPQELASLARTSHLTANAVRSLTHRRMADAAQGLEQWPVPIRNDLDSCCYPWFHYTPSCCRSSWSVSRHWGGEFASCKSQHGRVMRRCQEDFGIFPASGILGSVVGCRCAARCVPAQRSQGGGENGEAEDVKIGCTCGYTSDGVYAYTHESKLQLMHQHWDGLCEGLKHNHSAGNGPQRPDCESPEVSDELDSDVNAGPLLILECGGACSCSAECCLRVTQRGLSDRVIVVRHRFTGWGLHAAQRISKGSFVCEYAGELLTTVQSRERQRNYDEKLGTSESRCGSALLVVREYMPSGGACVRINVDATRIGNVARFIIYACDGGNLLPCLARAAGSVIPRLVLFARQDICDGEDLRYSYGSGAGVAGKVLPCYCGTPACLGTLPSDTT